MSVRRADEAVVERIRLCWRHRASARSVLAELARLMLDAHRYGCRLVVDEAPAELADLMRLCGLDAARPTPTAASDRAPSGGEPLRQVECGEQ